MANQSAIRRVEVLRGKQCHRTWSLSKDLAMDRADPLMYLLIHLTVAWSFLCLHLIYELS